MCQQCADACREIFPEVPQEEIGNFLVGTTCFPCGESSIVRAQLLVNRERMTTDDWRECYAIAAKDIDEAMGK